MLENRGDQSLDYLAIKDGNYKSEYYVPTSKDYLVLTASHAAGLIALLPEVMAACEITRQGDKSLYRPKVASLVEEGQKNIRVLDKAFYAITQQLDQFDPGSDLYLIVKYKEQNTQAADKKLRELQDKIDFMRKQVQAVNSIIDLVTENKLPVDKKQIYLLELSLENIANTRTLLENINMESIDQALFEKVRDLQREYKNKRAS